MARRRRRRADSGPPRPAAKSRKHEMAAEVSCFVLSWLRPRGIGNQRGRSTEGDTQYASSPWRSVARLPADHVRVPVEEAPRLSGRRSSIPGVVRCSRVWGSRSARCARRALPPGTDDLRPSRRWRADPSPARPTCSSAPVSARRPTEIARLAAMTPAAGRRLRWSITSRSTAAI